jgi:hypothetical protein
MRAALALLIGLLLLPGPASGWGFDVHRLIVHRAIDALPPPIKAFYDKHRTYVVEHCIDPDLWRNAGFVEEPPNHFLDIDAYGPYPFSDLPRDKDAAVKKFGSEMIVKNGLLPWRAQEMFDRLTRSFEQHSKGGSLYALEDAKFFSAVLAHYVSDAHVPFHAVVNYDGQLTNQHGIHARFETELVMRNEAALAIKPPAMPPVGSMRDFIFDTLTEGTRLVPPILDADRKAVEGKEFYDDEYFARFLVPTKPILERRLSESAAAVAAAIVGAWERAGKPNLPLNPTNPPRRVRRPNP